MRSHRRGYIRSKMHYEKSVEVIVLVPTRKERTSQRRMDLDMSMHRPNTHLSGESYMLTQTGVRQSLTRMRMPLWVIQYCTIEHPIYLGGLLR